MIQNNFQKGIGESQQQIPAPPGPSFPTEGRLAAHYFLLACRHCCVRPNVLLPALDFLVRACRCLPRSTWASGEKSESKQR